MFRRTHPYLVVLALGATALLAGCGGQTEPAAQPIPSSSAPKPQPVMLTFGQSHTFADGFSITVPEPERFTAPQQPDTSFMKLTYEITKKPPSTDRQKLDLALANTDVVIDNDRVQALGAYTSNYSQLDCFADAPLTVGETATCEIAYEAPSDDRFSLDVGWRHNGRWVRFAGPVDLATASSSSSTPPAEPESESVDCQAKAAELINAGEPNAIMNPKLRRLGCGEWLDSRLAKAQRGEPLEPVVEPEDSDGDGVNDAADPQPENPEVAYRGTCEDGPRAVLDPECTESQPESDVTSESEVAEAEAAIEDERQAAHRDSDGDDLSDYVEKYDTNGNGLVERSEYRAGN